MSFVEFSPVSHWLDTCLPGQSLPRTVKSKVKTFNVALNGKEKGMYHGLCQGFNDLLDACGQSKHFVMKVTGNNHNTSVQGTAEDGDDNKLKPDLVVYSETRDARKLFTLFDTGRSVGRTIWSHSEFMVEVKHDPRLAPFSSERPSDRLPGAINREDARGQLIEYAREMCSRQHRCFSFIISVMRHHARFIRIDRTAALVSEAFDYVKDPTPLATFVYRYTKATREARGFDPTATPATRAEAKMFRELPAQFSDQPLLQSVLRKAATPGWPIFKLLIRGQWSSDDQPMRSDSPIATRAFLVGRPLFRSHSMTGRGTRGFAAYDVVRQTIVFIKDYWRADPPEHLTEYEVYLALLGDEGQRCKFIPTLLGGGDVCGSPGTDVQRTLSGTFVDPPLPERVHVRLVMKEVCRRLQSFNDWRELVSVLRDALRAHQSAWEDHGILHRDLSVGNILIYERPSVPKPEVVGLLADWDLAKPRQLVLKPKASQPSRSGTWQFLSAGLGFFPNKPHVLSDDLESVMHVLNWLSLKHLETHYSSKPETLPQVMRNMYDTATATGLCSGDKWNHTVSGMLFFPHSFPPNHPFIALLRALSALCKCQYELLPPDDLAAFAANGTLEEACTSETRRVPVVEPLLYPWSAQPVNLDPIMPPLNDHRASLAAFDRALQQKEWPAMKKLDDQLPSDPPTSSFGAKRSATDAGLKGHSSKKKRQ
ncbi:hypothetical protein C8Q73DRAFT_45860 [Cubamyces lactineus]|nr:hypothetical protein C8Q73DRAFT_45860 [Cubamyces lactineus]